MKKISDAVNLVKKHSIYPHAPVVDSSHAPVLEVEGKKVLMFATNN